MRLFIVFAAWLCFQPMKVQAQAVPELLGNHHTLDIAPTSLIEALGLIRAQTGVRFVYSPSSLPSDQLVEISVENKPLGFILDTLFDPLGIDYQVIGNQIALRWVPPSQRTAYTQTIRGRVIDQDTKTPLIGANVVVASMTPIRGASTSSKGVFEIPTLPLGRHSLQIQYIGYEPILISELLLTAGKEIVLDIELAPSPIHMDMVVVAEEPNLMTPLNEFATTSARSFSVEHTQRFAASISDPARMAQSFSGVSRSEDDLLNEVIVRGHSPKYTVWRLEGIEIPNPNHFGDEGHSSGGVSMFSSNVLTYSDFFTGAFPAEYGNALAGVFDLNLRRGNTEHPEYTVGVGALGLEGTIEGPFSKKYGGSYLINYRYATLGLMSNLKIIDSDVIDYQDLSFKFYLPTRNMGVFSIFGIGGRSYFFDRADDGPCQCLDPSGVEEDHDDDDEEEKKGVAGISHRLILSDKSYLRTTVAAFGKFEREGVYLVAPPLSEDRIYVDEEKSEEKGFRANIKLTHRFNTRHLLQLGASGSMVWMDLNFRTRDNTPLGDWIAEIDAKERVDVKRGFAQWVFRPNTSWSFNAGLHTTHFSVNRETTWEPRFGVQWHLPKDKTLSLGIGLHSQTEPYGTYLLENLRQDSLVYSNRSLKISKSWHHVLAFEKRYENHTRFRTELYYNRGFDLPASADSLRPFSAINTYYLYTVYRASRELGGLKSIGTTTNYGLDISIERFFANGYYFMLNGSLFDASYTALQGSRYPSRYNTRFITNLVTGKEFNLGRQKKDVLSVNTRIIFGGGNRYTPIDIEETSTSIDIIARPDAWFSKQLAPYFRVDLGLTYTVNKSFLTHSVFFDIQNIIHRKNEGFVDYNPVLNKTSITSQLGILPAIGYRLTF